MSDLFGVDPAEPADVSFDAPVPRKRTKRNRKGGKKEAHAIGTASEVSTSAPPPRVGPLMSTPSTPMPTVSLFAPESSTSTGLVDGARENADIVSDVHASRKRTRGPGSKGARVRRNRKSPLKKTTPKSPVTYHVRNGQIVTLASEPAVPTIPPASQPEEEEAGQDAQMPPRIRHREGQENQALKTPLSSPANPSHPSPRSARLVKSSPNTAKEDAWSVIAKRGGTWPELPSVFSHWDVQVCFLMPRVLWVV
jgi:hypothetical protein